MPINEIGAASTVIVKYSTTAKPTGHVFRLYFDSVPVIGSASTVFSSYINPDTDLGWTLHDIIKEVVTRQQLSHNTGAWSVNEVEIWESEAGANTFVGIDPDDYSDVTGGTGSGIAAAYAMWVIKSTNRRQFRLTFFECASAAPQRFPLTTAPVEDNNTLDWFLTRSTVLFTTNDGFRLTNPASYNTGVNDHAAKKYGRLITP